MLNFDALYFELTFFIIPQQSIISVFICFYFFCLTISFMKVWCKKEHFWIINHEYNEVKTTFTRLVCLSKSKKFMKKCFILYFFFKLQLNPNCLRFLKIKHIHCALKYVFFHFNTKLWCPRSLVYSTIAIAIAKIFRLLEKIKDVVQSIIYLEFIQICLGLKRTLFEAWILWPLSSRGLAVGGKALVATKKKTSLRLS